MRQRNPLIGEKLAEGDTNGPHMARPSRMRNSRPSGNDKRFEALRQRSSSRRRRRGTHSASPDMRDEMRVAERSSSRRGSHVFGVDDVDFVGGIQQSFEDDMLPPVDFAFDPEMQETINSDSSDMSSVLGVQALNLVQSQDWTPWFEGLQSISTATPRSCQSEGRDTDWESPVENQATLNLIPRLSSSPNLSTSPSLTLTTTPSTSLQTRVISLRGPTGDWEAAVAMFDPTKRHSLLSQRTANVLGLNLVPLPWTEKKPRMTPFGIVYPEHMAHNVGVRCGVGSAAVPASIIVAPFEGNDVDVLIGCTLKEKLKRDGKGTFTSGISRSASLPSCELAEKGKGTALSRLRRLASLSSDDGGDFRKKPGLGSMGMEYQDDSVWQDRILDVAVHSVPFQQDALPIPNLQNNLASIGSGNETFQPQLRLNHSNVGLWGVGNRPSSSSTRPMERGLGDDSLPEIFGSLP